MSCDNRDSVLLLSNSSIEALKVIPYPEPGKWYVGFQVRCSQNKSYVQCPLNLRSSMVAVEIRLQPCGLVEFQNYLKNNLDKFKLFYFAVNQKERS
jgi:hypothetical protein